VASSDKRWAEHSAMMMDKCWADWREHWRAARWAERWVAQMALMMAWYSAECSADSMASWKALLTVENSAAVKVEQTVHSRAVQWVAWRV
jgi:hypothetical protein